MKFLTQNKKKCIICLSIIVFPVIVQCISNLAFISKDNDWIGFWGSYGGAIAGAGVAIYVLVETLTSNRKNQIREEIIEFCNDITEKSALFAQKYEETIYEAHTYLIKNGSQSVSKEEKLNLYRQFVATHHIAKAMLYEISNYLNIRENIDIFYSSKLEETQELITKAYEEFKNFEVEVGKAGNIEDINSSYLVEMIEKFLDMLNQYEREILEKAIDKHTTNMQLLMEKIFNDKKRKFRIEEENMVYYIEKVRKEIGDNKEKLLIYKVECNRKLHFCMCIFEICLIISIFFLVSITMIISGWIINPEEIAIIGKIVVIYNIIMLIGIVSYCLVISKRREKYYLIESILKSIELDIYAKK